MTYDKGHPWYYHLGGRVLYPREIAHAAHASGYKGWMERDILSLAALPDPKRSSELRKLRERVVDEYRRDVSRYRECARELCRYRLKHPGPVEGRACDGVHVALSLKYCHLFNDFSHLILLDELLARQPDLFGS